MPEEKWLQSASPAFRLMIATSWLAPDSWQSHQEKAIREAIDAGPDWTEYLALVDRHRTPALSWAALSRVPAIEIPQTTRQELRKRSDVCRMNSVESFLLLVDVLKRFNRAGIPVMPLKGQVLSYELYGDVGLRHTQDLDLEISKENIARGIDCLGEDWLPHSDYLHPQTPRQWESCLQNEQHIHFVHRQAGHLLELHWRNLWETPESTIARWNRSISSMWQGCAIQTLDPGDLTFYLCKHGALHAWFRAKWLGDVASAHMLGRLDWDAAFERAEEFGESRILAASLSLLNLLYEIPVPAPPRFVEANASAVLIKIPLQSLSDAGEPKYTGLEGIHNTLRMDRYERLLRPRKTFKDRLSGLFYRREDFSVLPLPDRFFWVYKPMRPFLLLWRSARHALRQLTGKLRTPPPLVPRKATGGKVNNRL